nr:MAG TPA: hypothetical protein [Caudoviricetes sp.]
MAKKQFLIVVFDMCLVKTQAESKEELLNTIDEMFPAEVDFKANMEVYDISETSPEKVYEMVEKYPFMSYVNFAESAEKITLIADLIHSKKGGAGR